MLRFDSHCLLSDTRDDDVAGYSGAVELLVEEKVAVDSMLSFGKETHLKEGGRY